MGRILGLDFGLRRVGGSISDPGRTIASPLEVYERGSVDQDARHYRELVREHEVERIVVGLPVHTSGREGELAARARDWGRWLASVTGLPVAYADERYTSIEADQPHDRVGSQAKAAKGPARQAGGSDPASGFPRCRLPGDMRLRLCLLPTRRTEGREHAHRRMWIPGPARRGRPSCVGASGFTAL